MITEIRSFLSKIQHNFRFRLLLAPLAGFLAAAGGGPEPWLKSIVLFSGLAAGCAMLNKAPGKNVLRIVATGLLAASPAALLCLSPFWPESWSAPVSPSGVGSAAAALLIGAGGMWIYSLRRRGLCGRKMFLLLMALFIAAFMTGHASDLFSRKLLLMLLIVSAPNSLPAALCGCLLFSVFAENPAAPPSRSIINIILWILTVLLFVWGIGGMHILAISNVMIQTTRIRAQHHPEILQNRNFSIFGPDCEMTVGDGLMTYREFPPQYDLIEAALSHNRRVADGKVIDENGNVVARLPGMPRRFDKIAWSPDGESVCYFAYGKLLRHRFNQSPEIIARPKSSPRALAVSPDGGLLLYTQPCGLSWSMLLTACETASGKEHFINFVSGRCFQIVAYSPEQAEKFRSRLSQEEDQ